MFINPENPLILAILILTFAAGMGLTQALYAQCRVPNEPVTLSAQADLR